MQYSDVYHGPGDLDPASKVIGMTVTGSAALEIVPTASAVLIEARSSVGKISFGTTEITGQFRGRVVDERLDSLLEGSAVVPVASLTSGSALYDNELRTRMNAQRFPEFGASLGSVSDLGSGRLAVKGDLTIHGTTRPQDCTAVVEVTERDPDCFAVVLSGTAVVDMRDYDIKLPSILMLRIYPDVTVRFRITAASAPVATEVAQ